MMMRSVWCAAMAFVAVGCTPPLEKVNKVMSASVEQCKKSPGPFAEVTLGMSGEKATVLRAACDLPITDVALVDEIHAVGKTGPYSWRIKLEDGSEVWKLMGVDWEELERAKSVREAKEPTTESLVQTETSLAAAQVAVPESKWIQLERLDNLLTLRARQRKAEEEPGIGDAAKAVLDETVAWGKEKDKQDVVADAQLRVIRSLKRYRGQQADAIDGLGQQDDWLIKAIDLAKKDKIKEDVDKYTKELEERVAKRPAEEARLKERVAALDKLLCEQIAQLNMGAIKDEELRKSAQAAQSSTKCLP
jgi:hypothetical protein